MQKVRRDGSQPRAVALRGSGGGWVAAVDRFGSDRLMPKFRGCCRVARSGVEPPPPLRGFDHSAVTCKTRVAANSDLSIGYQQSRLEEAWSSQQDVCKGVGQTTTSYRESSKCQPSLQGADGRRDQLQDRTRRLNQCPALKAGCKLLKMDPSQPCLGGGKGAEAGPDRASGMCNSRGTKTMKSHPGKTDAFSPSSTSAWEMSRTAG
jgi:hypothetical protein